MKRVRVVWVVGLAVPLTIMAAVLASNFVGGEKKIERHIDAAYALDDPRFARELGVLLGPPFVEGNLAHVLRNGDEIFPSMLASIRGARESITFETYIYWSGDIGRAFADALSERSRAGVKVHVLLDWVGSAKMEQSMLDEMSAAGVQIRKFHPPHWSHLGRLNNRTHRKLLWWTVAWVSLAAWASPRNGPGRHRIRRTGATRTFGSRGPWSPNSRPCSSTTGSR